MGAAGGRSVWSVVLPPKPPRPGVLERALAAQEGGAPRISVWMASARTPPTSSEGQAKGAAHRGAASHAELAATWRGGAGAEGAARRALGRQRRARGRGAARAAREGCSAAGAAPRRPAFL